MFLFLFIILFIVHDELVLPLFVTIIKENDKIGGRRSRASSVPSAP